MSDTAKPAVESLGIIKGHYECNYLDQTVPVLSELLALEVVASGNKEVTMKHPNTDWLLVVHESGADVPDKPFRNHYGVRVKNNEQVDRAYDYLMAKKEQLALKKVIMRNERAGSYSVFFVEPGGNYWEIESYEHRHQAGLPYDVSYPWQTELSEAQFPGRGYLPHGFTHGTIECNDWAVVGKILQRRPRHGRHHPCPNHQTAQHQTPGEFLVRGQPRSTGEKPQISIPAAALHHRRRLRGETPGSARKVKHAAKRIRHHGDRRHPKYTGRPIVSSLRPK